MAKERTDSQPASPVILVEEMKPFAPNSNPFDHDAWRMGQPLGANLLAMFDRHDPEDELILVHRPTGRRVRLRFDWKK